MNNEKFFQLQATELKRLRRQRRRTLRKLNEQKAKPAEVKDRQLQEDNNLNKASQFNGLVPTTMLGTSPLLNARQRVLAQLFVYEHDRRVNSWKGTSAEFQRWLLDSFDHIFGRDLYTGPAHPGVLPGRGIRTNALSTSPS